MNILRNNKAKGVKLSRVAGMAACFLLALFATFYLWKIFPVSDDEQRLEVHEKKIRELLDVFGECEVFFAGDSLQIEYDAFKSEKISDKELINKLRADNSEYDDKELVAYYAVYSAFMYLSERSVGERVVEVDCRVCTVDGSEATLVCQTKDEFQLAYTKSRFKTLRNSALIQCVYYGMRS